VGSIAIGQGITANQTGGFFIKHRGPGAYTVNPAGFLAGTNELVELTSSRRYKENIRDLEEVSVVFDTLRPVRYRAKPGHGDDREHIGLIAEEVEELFPEFVTYGKDGEITGVMFDRIVAVTIKEIKAIRKREADRDDLLLKLQEEIESLKSKMQ
jgi:Chaperone of endosialidase